MKEFFDTSVLIAAFWRGHVHHLPSLKRFAAAEKRHSACGIHSLAEVYAVMTALPVKPMIPPEQALLFVEEVRKRLTRISLSAEEYFAAIQTAASRGFSSARVYDSLLLACAAKCKAQAVYTWNLKHYQSLAPDLAPRIQTPCPPPVP
jgi:predicted nucleic acid-binding protein